MESDGPGSAPFASPHTSDAANLRYQELSTGLRDLLHAATRAQTPVSGDEGLQAPIAPTQSGGQRLLGRLLHRPGIVTPAQLACYMRIWITECAPWLDMFDQERVFGIKVPCLAQDSAHVLYAMLALSARQMERSPSRPRSSHSLELYSEAITALSAALDPRQPSVLVAACILCVLEMMSASPQDWRRHLEGCASLFVAAGVHGLSDGLLQAVFWCYARMDLCSSIISDGSSGTVLPINKWFLDESYLDSSSVHGIRQAILHRCGASPDMHANMMVYLTARICDLVAISNQQRSQTQDSPSSSEALDREWSSLWKEVRTWHYERPDELLPVAVELEARPFPLALYAHYAAISSNQLYHTACILLQELHEKRLGRLPPDAPNNPLWHARCVVGISLSSTHKGCLNNAIQPLFVAGRLFTHKDEHTTIVQLLETIESSSGWAARWRIRDLETAWGYAIGTFSSASAR